jgi:hypothetical protein
MLRLQFGLVGLVWYEEVLDGRTRGPLIHESSLHENEAAAIRLLQP